jgi:hypothetical protein
MRRLAWESRESSLSRSAISRRSCAYAPTSPRSECISAANRAASCSCRAAVRASPTTDRSAWNWANEEASSSRARARPNELTRLTAML